MNMKHLVYGAGAAVAGWLGYTAWKGHGVPGGVPTSGSAAIQPATGRLRQPPPLGGAQSQSYGGSAPQGQSTGYGQPPASGVLADAANALRVGKGVVDLGAAAGDLATQWGLIGGTDDASAYPDMGF